MAGELIEECIRTQAADTGPEEGVQEIHAFVD